MSEIIYSKFTNCQTGHRLDSNDKGQVYPHAPNDGDFQKWALEHVGSSEHTIRNVATGLYLNTDNDGNVCTLPLNGNRWQKWYLVEQKLVNVETARALDCNGSFIYTKVKNEDNCQNWVYELIY